VRWLRSAHSPGRLVPRHVLHTWRSALALPLPSHWSALS